MQLRPETSRPTTCAIALTPSSMIGYVEVGGTPAQPGGDAVRSSPISAMIRSSGLVTARMVRVRLLDAQYLAHRARTARSDEATRQVPPPERHRVKSAAPRLCC